ncbi:hypothetical protein M378DRAFT_12463 [Amanita muscaria Koide BX008]|uniref:Uncharacterized protein n=1 Tax=Amanita muscaria (strain Koide BX008) TaxID=946122 RepID=A0A0C2WMW5_AMAMK|nr:hypothetical protein M378DRAFT_12463 [Amanita muscaria Koide BX008]
MSPIIPLFLKTRISIVDLLASHLCIILGSRIEERIPATSAQNQDVKPFSPSVTPQHSDDDIRLHNEPGHSDLPLVSQSSGQFVYASTVMKYVGAENESAVVQLNVILGLKPSTGESPFSELGAPYVEILQQQSDQNFLKDFLAVLVVRIALADMLPGGNFHEDDAMLLGLDKKQLHRKLRGMRSLLKYKPFIDVYHKSFLDFLDDSSRSGEYHVSKHFANRRYMELLTNALVNAASRAMEQPEPHEGNHFQPRFGRVTRRFPLDLELPLNDLEEILRPLLIIQENLLQLPNMSVPWKPRACDECWTFYMIDDLVLRLGWFRAIQLQELKYVGIRPLTAMEERQSICQFDLDTCLSLLLGNLGGVESQLSLDMENISLVRALVRFDPTEIAMKVRSITDAQNLFDLIFCLKKNDCFNSWFGARASVATRADSDKVKGQYQGKAVKTGYDVNSVWGYVNALVWASLSHSNVAPLFELFDTAEHPEVTGDYTGRSVFKLSLNDDIFRFGLLFYEVLFNTEIDSLDRFWCNTAPVMSRPSEAEIHDDVWQLITWCCAEDPNERPTMDQVVQEIESWVSNNQSLSS